MAYSPPPTTGNDIIDGDDAPDTIDALAGDDLLRSWGGDDILYGGTGNDTLDSGTGADVMHGGPGNDRYYIVSQYDTVTEAKVEGFDELAFMDAGFAGIALVPLHIERFILAGARNTHIDMAARGNLQDNIILGNNAGHDRIWGGAGNDFIQGDFPFVLAPQSNASATGDDTLRGEDGDDTIWGDQGPYVGEPGDDFLYGDAGNDALYGQRGNDHLYGGDGHDLLDGGADNDFVNGDLGADRLTGGTGDDMLIVDDLGDTVVEFADEGTDGVQSYIDHSLVDHVENLILIGDFAVYGGGNQGANVITGNGLDNELRGWEGNDQLFGREGNDFLDGGFGQDLLVGGAGSDQLIVNDEGDVVMEGSGGGRDRVQTYIDYILPEEVEDLLVLVNTGVHAVGNSVSNIIFGGGGDDFIDGRAGTDVVYAGAGDDLIGTDDVMEAIDGEAGVDTLQIAAGLTRLDLAGRAGNTLNGIEVLDLGNGEATTLVVAPDDVRALSPFAQVLRIEGEAGDTVEIGPGWTAAAGAPAGYARYTGGTGDEQAVLVVAQAVGVIDA
jgi:Ca2+-binding RTX toxin-like protein